MLDSIALQKLLDQHFSLEELRQLCFELEVEYENISGETRRAKARNLVEHLRQAGRIAHLVSILELMRPSINWKAQPPDNLLCPYRGLLSFREEDAHLFFGRQAFVEKLLVAVKTQSLTAVVGASGSGKSSVVFAGLVPRLRQQSDWLILNFNPGRAPFQSLAAALVPWLKPELDEIEQPRQINKLARILAQQEAELSQYVNSILIKHKMAERLLLIVDQFEELYTSFDKLDERTNFLDQLLTLGDENGRRQMSHLVLTLRADFMEEALSYRPFADALQNTDQKLGPMKREELHDVISNRCSERGCSSKLA